MKQTRDPHATRTNILHAAEACFAEKGYAASVNDIAHAARINKRMIYHYFGDKEGLWQAVLMHQYEKAARPELNLPDNAPLPEIIEYLVEQYYHFLARDENFVKIILHENLRGGQSIRNLAIAKTKTPILRALQSALKEMRRPDDPNQLLIDCFALCFFYFSNRHTLSAAIGRDLTRPQQVRCRIRHVKALLKRALIAE